MNSDIGTPDPKGVRVSPRGLTLGAVLFGAASWWALGTPDSDPLGAVFDTVRNGAGNYADWAREGPVDGHPDWEARLRPVAGGDAARGREVVLTNGCGSCHVIPGLPYASGTVGPSLAAMADRAYIAGVLSNTAENMVTYLADPAAVTPRTAMPDVGLTPGEAADAAAFLYTLSARP